MNDRAIGKLIKTARIERKMTQKELCNGICSTSLISRIESGTRHGNHAVVERLLERLGISEDLHDENNSRIRLIIRQANQADIQDDKEVAWDLLSSIQDDYDNFSTANKQRYDTLDTMMTYEINKITTEDRLKILEEVLRTTIKDYSIDNLPKYMTQTEAQLLELIANTYGIMENYDTSITILYHVKQYYETAKIDKIVVADELVVVCYNLSKFLGLSKRYTECIEVAKEGIKWHYTVGVHDTLPLTMYNCAWALARRNKVGDKEEAHILADKAIEICASVGEYIDISETLEGNIHKLIDDYLS